MRLKVLKSLVILSLLFLPFAVQPVQADYAGPILYFAVEAGAGSISYSGGASPLTTPNAWTISSVTGFFTGSANDFVPVTIYGGQLTFTTGAGNADWTWNRGGSLLLTGSLTDGGKTVNLLTGESLFANINSSGVLKAAFGGFNTTVNQSILDYYGLNQTSWIGTLNGQFSTTAGFGASFSNQAITGGDVQVNPVPLPAAFWLLGAGLVSLIGIRRRVKH